MRKIFFLLLFTTACFVNAKAQKGKELRDSTVVVIFSQNNTGAAKEKRKKSGEQNIVKIAPLGFISGTYPILYERVITDFFTVQVGGGLTGKDYFRNLLESAGNDDGSNSNVTLQYPWGDNSSLEDAADPLFNLKNRTSTIGYMFTIQPRLYFENEAPEDDFIGVSYDYYHYGLTIPGLVVDPNSGEAVHKGSPKSEHENIGDIMVHFGSQYVYDNLTVEWTSGIGLRNVSGEKYVATFDGTTVANEGFATYKQNIFNFEIGFKVGYHF